MKSPNLTQSIRFLCQPHADSCAPGLDSWVIIRKQMLWHHFSFVQILMVIHFENVEKKYVKLVVSISNA